eukprot:GILJ01005579.1.p1 GENE.GILJ01005579.1~~GILJ01005579.1.p1  ORF type:complete len:482 (-),score=74.24 GILJ01005579.1:287-1732(-)
MTIPNKVGYVVTRHPVDASPSRQPTVPPAQEAQAAVYMGTSVPSVPSNAYPRLPLLSPSLPKGYEAIPRKHGTTETSIHFLESLLKPKANSTPTPRKGRGRSDPAVERTEFDTEDMVSAPIPPSHLSESEYQMVKTILSTSQMSDAVQRVSNESVCTGVPTTLQLEGRAFCGSLYKIDASEIDFHPQTAYDVDGFMTEWLTLLTFYNRQFQEMQQEVDQFAMIRQLEWRSKMEQRKEVLSNLQVVQLPQTPQLSPPAALPSPSQPIPSPGPPQTATHPQTQTQPPTPGQPLPHTQGRLQGPSGYRASQSKPSTASSSSSSSFPVAPPTPDPSAASAASQWHAHFGLTPQTDFSPMQNQAMQPDSMSDVFDEGSSDEVQDLQDKYETAVQKLHQDKDGITPKKRGKLPKDATDLLKQWLAQHFTHPYPTDHEKKELASAAKIEVAQVTNWFTNARKRLWQPMVSDKGKYKRRRLRAAEEVTT